MSSVPMVDWRPWGHVRISPQGEDGVIYLRADCIQSCFVIPVGGAILDLEGKAKVEFQAMVTGVMGGRKFAFKIEEPVEEILQALHIAHQELGGLGTYNDSVILDNTDPKDPTVIN